MLVTFTIWCCLVIFSLCNGLNHSTGHRTRLVLSNPLSSAYHLGISYRQYDAASSSGKRARVDTLTIGFLLLTVEIDFFKPADAP